MIELAPGHKQGLVLRSAVMLAAGSAGFGAEYRGLVDFGALGALVTHPLTWQARRPAATAQAVATPGGVLIHSGLPNPGVNGAARRYAGQWQKLGCPVIVHLAAESPEAVQRSVARLEATPGVSGIELGFRDDIHSGEAAAMIAAAVSDLPVLVQAPAGRGVEFAALAGRAGAQAVVVGGGGRAAAMGREGVVNGRLYGPLVFAQTLYEVQQVRATTALPVVAVGGVYGEAQARALLQAGALAVQVDGWLWADPAGVTQLAAVLHAPD